MKLDLAVLKSRIARLGVSQKSLADELGWDASRLSRFLNGKTENPSIRAYVDVVEAIERHETALTSAAGNPIGLQARSGQSFEHAAPLTPRPVSDQIPVYGLVGAAANGSIHLNHSAVITTTSRHPAQGSREDVFALEVWNESMSPRYEPGELVYCVRGRLPRRGQDCVVEMKSGDAFLKTYEKQEGSRIFTRQLNPEEMVHFDATAVKAIHAVVGRG